MRKPTQLDHSFILECYSDWPVTEIQGPVTPDDVKRFINRWYFERDGERCLIGDHGLISWRQNFFAAVIDNIVVHPAHRRRGHAREMWRFLRDKLVSEGVVVAQLYAIPGPIADKVGTTFIHHGDGIGERSGLPIKIGLVTADMEI